MNHYSVDTNVFLRFLIQDDPAKTDKAKSWFEKAATGLVQLNVESIVLPEIVFVLSRYYKLPKQNICEKLRSILGLSFINIENRQLLTEALDVYEKHGVDFADAIIFVQAIINQRKILSFDKGYDKLTPSIRVEP